MNRLLYLHGFRSSAKSKKATQLKAWLDARGLADRCAIPDLPHEPEAAIALARQLIGTDAERVTVVGSSLGGFYATVLAESLGCHAVLLNPAVHPQHHLQAYIGTQTNLYTGLPFAFEQGHVDMLARLDPPRISRLARYWLIVETGDTVCPAAQAIAHYAGARQTVMHGGSHDLISFGQHIAAIADYSGVL